MPLDSKTLPRLNWSIRVLALVFLTFFCWANPSYGQREQIDSLAAKVASAILKSSEKTSGQQLVMVLISESDTGPTELGAKIVGQFTSALAARGISLNNMKLQQTEDEEKIPLAAMRDPGTFACVASVAGATFTVHGAIQGSESKLNFHLAVVRASDSKVVFKDYTNLDRTPELAELQKRSLPSQLVQRTPESKTNIPEAGKNGYTEPICVYCPNPKYSDRAFAMKEQGTLVLDVVIAPDGKAHSVTILRGLSCGLNQVVINSVENVYRFKPAVGPDGKPAAVHMLMEVEFHLY